ncbi:MAG TPA: ABC transporter permease [Blastocatellia bacterium]|nr:ABC transporter permease [Blastocatellia bacterium]
METLLQDLRYGMRMLMKNPGFTLVAVITMALGIGANTALFSVVNGVMLKSLPFKEPDRLVFTLETNAKFPSPGVSASTLNYRDWKEQSHSFESMGARQGFVGNLTSNDQPEKIQGEKVTWDYFPTLGVAPIAGSLFTEDQDRPGGPPVILLSKGLFERRFGGDKNIVGQTIPINGQGTTVIGIMPNDYRPNIEFWVPMGITYQNADRNLHNIQVVGRLAPGVTREQAQAEMSNIAAGLAEQYADSNTGWGVAVVPFHDLIVLNIRPALMLLLAAVGVVLLIACANVANLLLARAASREKEIAIRLALGASRGRLIRQVLTESVLLSIIGGALGVLISLWGTDALVGLNRQGIPRASEIGVEGRVLVFALLVSVAAGILFGLVPALQASRPNLNETLKESGKSSSGHARGHRTRGLLVVVQVALAFVLLMGAGLLIKSFSELQRVNVGFNRERLLTMQVSLPPAQYPRDTDVISFYKESIARLSALPAVTSASAISQAPLAGGGPQFIFAVEGRPLPTPSDAPIASYRIVLRDYFQTMNIPLIKGRAFTEADDQNARQVVVINQNMADLIWPGEDPLGKRVTVGVPAPGEQPDWATVIGVVGNVKHTTLAGETGMQMYHPAAQTPFLALAMGRTMTFILRAQTETTGLIEPARSVFASLNPTLPVSNVKTMETIIHDAVAPFRFNMLLFVLFAAIAILLTMVGVYGVMNYAVTQRTREIGIRMALGAQASQVRGLVLKQGLALSGMGLVIGLGGSLIVTRLMSSLLYGVSATDPVIFVAVGVVLALVSVMACYVPARKATKVDPMIALRYE